MNEQGITDQERRQLWLALNELAKWDATGGGLIGVQYNNIELVWEVGGFKVLGSGLSRLVVSLGEGRVAKLELGREGENAGEALVFAGAGPLMKTLLCPILAYEASSLGSFLVMPKCELVSEDEFIFGFDEEREIDLESGPADLAVVGAYISQDALINRNLGRLEGRLVTLDYGSGGAEGVEQVEIELLALRDRKSPRVI